MRQLIQRHREIMTLARAVAACPEDRAVPMVTEFLTGRCGLERVELPLPRGSAGRPEALAAAPLDAFTLSRVSDLLSARLAGTARADPLVRFLGASPAAREIRHRILQFSTPDTPLLIIGERGTGKGLVARIAHEVRGGSQHDFFSLNCSAVPEALAESELFGHRKGAFTGALSDREGLLLAAHRARGGLLLDDIAEFPAGIQPKLLHAVEDRTFYPLGSSRPVSIGNGHGPGLRIYATCQPDAMRKLRPDLRDRLSGCVLELPPLRERLCDVLSIAEHKLARLRGAKGEAPTLDEDAWFVLLEYEWPGNVRQLQNVLERALALGGERAELTAGVLRACVEYERRLQRLSEGSDLNKALSAPTDQVSDRFATLEEVEVRHVRVALERTGGNVSAAARLLGLKRTTLQSRLRAINANLSPTPVREASWEGDDPSAG